MLKRNGVYGLTEVYVRCQAKGYTRSFESMCRQIRKRGYQKPKIRRKSYTNYDRIDGEYPGDVEKHQNRYNKTAKTCLNFKSPNQAVTEYFSKCNLCLDN